MGRPAGPIISETLPRLRDLVKYLRQLKDEAGLTYAALSKRTSLMNPSGYRSASALSHAARGTAVPPRATVTAYVDGCSAADSPESQAEKRQMAERLWKAAAAEKARPSVATRSPRAQQIRTVSAFSQGLSQLRQRAGQPSLRTIEQATKVDGYCVSRSKASQIFRGELLPTQEQLMALLTVLDVFAASAAKWCAIRDRIANRRLSAPAVAVRHACTDLDPAFQEILRRRERDEDIKRRTGRIPKDHEYED